MIDFKPMHSRMPKLNRNEHTVRETIWHRIERGMCVWYVCELPVCIKWTLALLQHIWSSNSNWSPIHLMFLCFEQFMFNWKWSLSKMDSAINEPTKVSSFHIKWCVIHGYMALFAFLYFHWQRAQKEATISIYQWICTRFTIQHLTLEQIAERRHTQKHSMHYKHTKNGEKMSTGNKSNK